ncbi:MAG: SDR family NAD(P)-dependent oxidoreductase [Chloroflexota bacterium]
MRFENKVAIVTGASRGIGKVAAVALAREGARVVVAARTEEASQLPGTIHETVREIEALGGKALAVRTDVSDEASVDEMVRCTLEAFGRIDVLVNNAAVAFYPPVVETPPRRWDLVLRVNIRGPFLCSRAVLPRMIEQRSGSIVNLSSKAADINGPTYVGVAYCTAKAAVERFSNALAEEVKQYNIAVNAIKPRQEVSTEGMRFWNPKADWSRWDKPEDFLVKGILFLAGQDARLTGQVVVDKELCRRYKL